MRGSPAGLIFRSMKALIGLLAASVVFFALKLLSFRSWRLSSGISHHSSIASLPATEAMLEQPTVSVRDHPCACVQVHKACADAAT